METKKYLQHLLALLGTPGTTKATQVYYASLPHTEEYGAHIIDKARTGQQIEVRSRLEKTLKQTLPNHLKEFFHLPSSSASLPLPSFPPHPPPPAPASMNQDDGSPPDPTPLSSLAPSVDDLEFLSNPLSQIFLKSLQLDPQKRPTFVDLSEMSFFSEQFSTSSSSQSSDRLVDMGRLLEFIRSVSVFSLTLASLIPL
jgi:serine/threonine protein kinase